MKAKGKALLAVFAVGVTVGVLWYHHRPLPSKNTSWEDVVDEAKRGGYRLIRTEDLWDRYGNDPESLLLVDTRQEWEYRTGHMKGAVNFPVEPTWLSRWRNKAGLETFLGPDKNRFIVFY